MAIVPVQLARVSNLLRQTVSTGQISRTQEELLKTQNELSTGKRLNVASDDPGDAAIVQQLQKTLEQRDAYLTNLQSAQNQLSEADSAMGDLTDLLQQAQTIASANVGSDVTGDQRTAAAAIVKNLYGQAMTLANRQFSGAYLFNGDRSTEAPFEVVNGGVRYNGTGHDLLNAVDENTDQAFTANGADIFGGFSSEVKGTRSLAPAVGAATRLGDLGGARGEGVAKNAIQIGNGSTSTVVDLSNADSIGDVIAAINAAAVGGITASVSPSGNGLRLTGAAGDDITVNEVGGGTSAADLGIFLTTGGGAGAPLLGQDVQTRMTEFSTLASLNNGSGINASGLTISNGQTNATVAVPPGGTVGDLLNAINNSGTGAIARINDAGTGIDILNPVQGLQMSVGENGGTTAADLGVRSMNPATTLAALNAGQGVRTVAGPDFQVTRSDGTAFNVDVDGANTVQDVINAINTADGGAGVTASFANVGNGIVLTDTAGGGGTLSLTPLNGSDAVTDLGLGQSPAVGNVITGTDVNAPVVDGIFTSFSRLQRALETNDQREITASAHLIELDQSRVVRVRGETGARVQELESRHSRILDQNVATQALLSQLSDTDFAETISRFQTLQNSLQATLQTTGQILNLSLLDFIG